MKFLLDRLTLIGLATLLAATSWVLWHGVQRVEDIGVTPMSMTVLLLLLILVAQGRRIARLEQKIARMEANQGANNE